MNVLPVVSVVLLLAATGCNDPAKTETRRASRAKSPPTCTQVGPHIILVHETQLYMPGDPSEKVANGGRYASAAIRECTRDEWTVEVRTCLADAFADRAGTDACLRLLTPKQRANLGGALARVEADMPGFQAPARSMEWLAP